MSMNIVPSSSAGGSVTVTPPYLVSGANLYGPLIALTDPTTPSWTWQNQSSATITNVNNSLVLYTPSSAGAVNMNMRLISMPSTPFTATALIRATCPGVSFTRFGLCFFESGTGKISSINPAAGTSLAIDYWTNATTYSSTPLSINGHGLFNPTFWRLAHDGTNLTYSWSIDGNYFVPVYTHTKTTHFTAGPDKIGWFVNSNSNQPVAATLLSWTTA